MNTEARKFGELVGNVATSLVMMDTNKDGKVQLAEALSAISAVTVGILGNFGSFGEAWRQLKEEGAPARAEFIDGFKSRFDLPDDEIESAIEDTIAWIDQGVVIGNRWAGLLKKDEAVTS